MALGGGFELALACDFLVVEESTTFIALEVMGGMVPVAGGIQRLAERIGRTRTIRMVMLAEPLSGQHAAALVVFSTMALIASLAIRSRLPLAEERARQVAVGEPATA
jgi:enoyl-CoA hydratase/carnithine racemase